MGEIWIASASVESLLQCCLHKLIEHLPKHINGIFSLPRNLKDRVIYLMSKRGLISDDNISQVLHDRVHTLDLTECDVGEEGLLRVAQMCPNLRSIDLNSTKSPRISITSQSIVALSNGCRHLQSVYLRRCTAVDDDAVVALSERCASLRLLNLGGCSLVTDRSLGSIGQHCPLLRSINFSKANVTDDGVFQLVGAVCGRSLQEIHMDGCTSLTDQSIEAVINMCPNISVLIFHGCPKITNHAREILEERFVDEQRLMKQITWTVY